MYKTLIIKYIPKITLEDIIFYGQNNNIFLSDDEAKYILKTIQKDYLTLLSPNYMTVFEKSKLYLSSENYKKILNTFLTYQEKYKIF